MQTHASPEKITQLRRARLATVESLRANLLRAYFDPVPSTKTLHAWLRRARVPYFKSNPTCSRGGGPVFYSVAAIEKLIRQRTGNADLGAAATPATNGGAA